MFHDKLLDAGSCGAHIRIMRLHTIRRPWDLLRTSIATEAYLFSIQQHRIHSTLCIHVIYATLVCRSYASLPSNAKIRYLYFWLVDHDGQHCRKGACLVKLLPEIIVDALEQLDKLSLEDVMHPKACCLQEGVQRCCCRPVCRQGI